MLSSQEQHRPPFLPHQRSSVTSPSQLKRESCHSSPQMLTPSLWSWTLSLPDAGGNPPNTLPAHRPSHQPTVKAQCWASTSTEMKKKPSMIPRSLGILGMSTANDTQTKLNKC